MESQPVENSARQRLPAAFRISLYCCGGMLVISLLCAAYAHYDEYRSIEARFRSDADIIHQLAILAIARDSTLEPTGELRTYFQYELKRGSFDQLAVVAGRKIVLAHTADWEGMNSDLALGHNDLPLDFGLQNPETKFSVMINREHGRMEGLYELSPPGFSTPVYLYLANDWSVVGRGAWTRFYKVLAFGLILTLSGGVLVYLSLHSLMFIPLKDMKERLEKYGLDVEFNAQELGELKELADALQNATRRLLAQEEGKQSVIKTRLVKLDEESGVQTELLRGMVRDLRKSMSSVLGHAELLISGDSKAADRINHIRAIQQEAKRLSRLAYQLHTLFATLSSQAQTGGESSLPIEQIREVIDQLSKSEPNPIFDAAEMSDVSGSAISLNRSIPSALSDSSVPEVAPIPQRLSGSVLVVGRQDQWSQGLVGELLDVGIDAIWVPDIPNAQLELSQSTYDLLVVNLCKADRSALENPKQLQRLATGLPVIALLPESIRGDGEKYVQLGCSDYLYTPVTRRNVLAVFGKYLGYKPVG